LLASRQTAERLRQHIVESDALGQTTLEFAGFRRENLVLNAEISGSKAFTAATVLRSRAISRSFPSKMDLRNPISREGDSPRVRVGIPDMEETGKLIWRFSTACAESPSFWSSGSIFGSFLAAPILQAGPLALDLDAIVRTGFLGWTSSFF